MPRKAIIKRVEIKLLIIGFKLKLTYLKVLGVNLCKFLLKVKIFIHKKFFASTIVFNFLPLLSKMFFDTLCKISINSNEKQ